MPEEPARKLPALASAVRPKALAPEKQALLPDQASAQPELVEPAGGDREPAVPLVALAPGQVSEWEEMLGAGQDRELAQQPEA